MDSHTAHPHFPVLTAVFSVTSLLLAKAKGVMLLVDLSQYDNAFIEPIAHMLAAISAGVAIVLGLVSLYEKMRKLWKN